MSEPGVTMQPIPGRGPRATPRACDSCKHRKVKCDSSRHPCVNCQASGSSCTYMIEPRKRGPKGKRLPSNSLHTVFRTTEHTTRQITNSPRSPVPVPNLILESTESTTNATSPSWSISSIQLPHRADQRVQKNLIACLADFYAGSTIEEIAQQCINLYMQYLFPVAPIVHEPSLRALAPVLQEPTLLFEPHTMPTADIKAIRQWTLLTSFCAATSYLLPSALFPAGDSIGKLFLQASRDMLKEFQDYDIEFPDYSSLAIRYFQSNALHAVGETRVSWHVLGEAIRLVQEMKLFEEQSLQELDPIEERLRRNTFWQIYTGDKSASILNGRPVALHQVCLGTQVTTAYSDSTVLLLDPSSTPNTRHLEGEIVKGFDICQDLWARASNILLQLASLDLGSGVAAVSTTLSDHSKEQLLLNYLHFSSTLDHTPPGSLDHEQPTERLRIMIDIQNTNFRVSYHCLRLVILQKFYDCGLMEVIGLSNDAFSLNMRKIEFASDMIQVLKEAPFMSLQINGEPCVEKIRRMGVALLEIVHEGNQTYLKERAKALFPVLLDILARLDSRVSHDLESNCGF